MSDTELQNDEVISEEDLDSLEGGMTQEQAKSFEDQFAARVQRTREIIQHNPEKFYTCVAEIHTLLIMFEESIRGMMLNGGPRTMLRILMGRGKKNG